MGGCAQYATVSESQPRFRPIRGTLGALAQVERGFATALEQEQTKPLEAVGELLVAAEAASRQLARHPSDEAALDAYNFAVARVFGIIKKASLDPWNQPLLVNSSTGAFQLTRRPDKRKEWNPALYEFTPSDQFAIDGTYVTERSKKDGLGAPLVVIGREMNKDAAADFRLPKTYYSVTAVIRFEGRRAVIGFEDPLATETVKLAGHTYPLAADFTVPIAVMLAMNDPKKQELFRLLRPAKYAETARIARLQPYDPSKTVVLVIHGLADSAATWAPMLIALRGHKEIRQNYQFWFYSYPSGYPYPYSAAILRRELDAIRRRYPMHKKMVVVGHSMGGCISRLLITDTGEILWRDLFRKGPDEADLSEESRRMLKEALIFRHRPEVGRVVFMAAPLRGSELASGWIGRLGSALVTAPAALLTVGGDAIKNVTFQEGDLKLTRVPNSVDTLAPNNRFVRAVQKIPVTKGIPHHVISGDRGKGGNTDRTPPIKSDGVVPYWSSHMETAASELVVPSDHSVHQNAQAIAEIARILKIHRQGARARRVTSGPRTAAAKVRTSSASMASPSEAKTP